MPKYRIGRSYGYAGTRVVDIIEADSLAEAEEAARDVALQHVEYWADLVDEEDADA